MNRMFLRSICRLVFVCAISGSLFAQSSEDALRARLLNKPLDLRGLWQYDKLHFDSGGKLLGKPHELPFTLCGINVTGVTLKPTGLVLEGQRVGLLFEKLGPTRIVLPNARTPERMHLEIDAPANKDYTAALDAIFADDLPPLVPILPPEWQRFAGKFLLKDSEQPPPLEGVRQVGGGVSPPRLLSSVDPGYNNYARAAKVSGISTINLIVDEHGRPTHLSVVRPLGVGLDEQALAAVRQYTFSPAMFGGKPVAVAMNVEVNFQIF